MGITIFVGNLGRDPEMRETTGGQKVTNLSIAENRNYKDSEGNARKETIWYRVAVWGAQAEPCNEHLSKGRQVQVIGRLIPDKDGNPRIWEGNDGFAHASFELTAQQVTFLGSSNGTNGGTSPDLKVAPAEEEDVQTQLDEKAQLALEAVSDDAPF